MVQSGEEIVITNDGRPVARLMRVAPEKTEGPAAEGEAWLEKLTTLREATATGKTLPATEEILDDLRAERL